MLRCCHVERGAKERGGARHHGPVATGVPVSTDPAPGANVLPQIGWGWQLFNCAVGGPRIQVVHDPAVELVGLMHCPSVRNVGSAEMGSVSDCAALAAGRVPPRHVPQSGGTSTFPCGGTYGDRHLPWGETWPASIVLK